MLFSFLNFMEKLNEWTGKFVSLWMIPMIVVMSFEVFMRYVMASPTIWGTELVTYLFASYILLGGGYTLLHGAHVNINVFYNRMEVCRRALFDLLTACIFFVYTWVLFHEGLKFALDGWSRNRHSGTDWNPPLYPILMTVPIGAFLLLIQGVSKFIRDFLIVVRGKEPPR